MAQQRVPDSLIRRLCYPSSYRLPKLVHLEFPKKVIPVVSAYNRNYDAAFGRGSRLRAGTDHLQDWQKGNLHKDEYRFWIGAPFIKSNLSTCRWCKAMCYSPLDRKNHTSKGCNPKLITVYGALLREAMCVMCRKPTYGTASWGVPFCSKTCAEAWRYEDPPFLRFRVGALQAETREVMTR